MSLRRIEIIPREDWGARPPKRWRSISPSRMPAPELWQHHTVGDYRGAAGIRAIQNFHMDVRGWSDIAYSWIIDRRSLKIYEGRGPGVVGGHTRGHNSRSHAICVTGNFELYQPPDELLWVIASLVAHGHDQGWFAQRRLTGGHRDVGSTQCPGQYLYLAIPRINQYANSEEPTVEGQLIERMERAIVEGLGYTIEVDQDLEVRTVQAVEHIIEGTNNLIAREADYKAEVAQLRGEVEALTARVEAAEQWGTEVRGALSEAWVAFAELGRLLDQNNPGGGSTDSAGGPPPEPPAGAPDTSAKG